MTAGQVKELQEAGMSPEEIFDLVYEELTGVPSTEHMEVLQRTGSR